MFEQAWPYGYAIGPLAMEGIGVLESLHAANEQIKQHTALLKTHSSSVHIRISTDCQALLLHIARTKESAKPTDKLPASLIKKIKDLLSELQGHHIKVVVEMHWCPRYGVSQHEKVDELAGKAMRSGFGFCNATKNIWTEAPESAIIKQLEPMLAGAVSFRVPDATTASEADEHEKEPKKGRRRKKNTRRAAAAAMKRHAEEDLENIEGKSVKKARWSPKT